MEIVDIKNALFNIDLIATVDYIENIKEVQIEGRPSRVATLILKDDSGDMKMTIWNEQIDSFPVGTKIHIEKGYIKFFNGSTTINVGKSGKIVKVSN